MRLNLGLPVDVQVMRRALDHRMRNDPMRASRVMHGESGDRHLKAPSHALCSSYFDLEGCVDRGLRFT